MGWEEEMKELVLIYILAYRYCDEQCNFFTTFLTQSKYIAITKADYIV